MTKTIEEQQRKIELAEREYRNDFYNGKTGVVRIFPKFSVDTK